MLNTTTNQRPFIKLFNPIKDVDTKTVRLDLLDTMIPSQPTKKNKTVSDIGQLQSDVDELAAELNSLTVEEMAGCDIECEMELDPRATEAIRDVYQKLLAIPAEVQEQIFSFKMEGYLLGHVTRTAMYAALLAQKLNKDAGEEIIDPVRAAIAGFLHDLGKMQKEQKEISETEGRLSKEQYENMKSHPTFSAMALQALSVIENGEYLPFDMDHFRETYEGVLTHHRRHDEGGRSYPQYAKTNNLGELLAIADSFDAMTSNRSYNERRGDMQAQIDHGFSQVESCAGSQFNPEMAQAFCELRPTPTYNEPETARNNIVALALAA